MTLAPAVRHVCAVIAVLLLAGLGWTGSSEGVNQWSQSTTPAQRLQVALQVAYGVLAILSVVTVFTWRQMSRVFEAGFVLGATGAAGLAAVVWGGRTLLYGVLAALSALVIAAAIIWMLRVGAPSLRAMIRMEE